MNSPTYSQKWVRSVSRPYTPLGREDCDSVHEFVINMSARLKMYHYTPILRNLLTLRNGFVLIIFLRAVCIHGKSPWKVTAHPLW